MKVCIFPFSKISFAGIFLFELLPQEMSEAPAISPQKIKYHVLFIAKNLNTNKQLGGYSTQFQNIIAPLGRNNLLVIAGLLLLHHFAVESRKTTNKKHITK